MTEFEWRKSLRELRREAEVPAHVWNHVLARIESSGGAAHPIVDRHAAVSRPRNHRVAWQALAASALIATIAIAFTAKPLLERPALASALPAPATSSAPESSATADASDPTELARELARNPVLAATDAELRQLQAQLQQALALDPDSATLRRMFMRTEVERRRLLQYQSQLG